MKSAIKDYYGKKYKQMIPFDENKQRRFKSSSKFFKREFNAVFKKRPTMNKLA